MGLIKGYFSFDVLYFLHACADTRIYKDIKGFLPLLWVFLLFIILYR